jgi:hypothetical protein
VLFAGHSYGGATVLVAAAFLRRESVTRDIRYVTFGAPKGGDDRWAALVSTCQGISLANDGDIVPLIPPTSQMLAFLGRAGGLPNAAALGTWTYPPRNTSMRADGGLFGNPLAKDFFRILGMHRRSKEE